VEVDRAQGLHSVATRHGVRGAFAAARLLHVTTVACLIGVGCGLSVGVLYWLGVAAVALLLGYEHSLIGPRDLKRLDMAFFTMNGIISLVFSAFVLVDAVTS
jgi:4-hydroxybenzoate polyprenyltransferase